MAAWDRWAGFEVQAMAAAAPASAPVVSRAAAVTAVGSGEAVSMRQASGHARGNGEV